MTEISVGGARPYVVRVEPGAAARVGGLVSERSHAVLTDSNIEPLHVRRLGLVDAPVLVLEPGEKAKSFAGLELVLDFLCRSNVDRGGVLVTLGGGVLSDLGGLAASLYLRGIDVVHVPTTLLAQVDAAVGGKTALNLAAGKNLGGTFHAPLEVLVDPRVLATLDDEEFGAGLGEVVKSALIGAPELLDLLESNADAVLARESKVLERVVVAALGVKARLVTADEHERGERATLNLGHTFAHAIEHAAGFGRVPHGVAVAVGLGLALEASAAAQVLETPELVERVGALLERLGLPTSLAALRARYDVALAPEALIAGLRHDKKGPVGEPAFVLVRGAGRVTWGERLPEALWHALLSS